MDNEDYSVASTSLHSHNVNLTSSGQSQNNNNLANSNILSSANQEYSMAVMPDQISGIQQLLSSKYAKGSQSNLNIATTAFNNSPASETTMGVTPISNIAVAGNHANSNSNSANQTAAGGINDLMTNNTDLMQKLMIQKYLDQDKQKQQNGGRVAIFWDLENCAPPAGMPGYLVVENLRNVVHHFGPITLFKAYLEISDAAQKRAWRSELQSSGVSLTDCPHNGRKDSVDKMILVDMLGFAIDNPAPATIVLISGDRDFVYALSVLRNRCYTVVLIVPNKGAPIILRSQANAILEWKYDVLKFDAWKDAINNTPLNPVNQSGVTLPLQKSTSLTNLSVVDRGIASVTGVLAPIVSGGQGSSTTSGSSPMLLSEKVNGTVSAPPPGFQNAINNINSNSNNNSNSNINNNNNNNSNIVKSSMIQAKVKAQDSNSFISSPLANREQSMTRATMPRSSSNTSMSNLPMTNNSAQPNTAQASLSSAAVPNTAILDENDIMQSPRAPGFFDCLVEVLNQFHLSGDPKPLRSRVGHVLIQRNPFIYQRAGVSSFKDFSELAVSEGIVQMGGDKASAWIALIPPYNSLNNSAMGNPNKEMENLEDKAPSRRAS